MLAICRFRSSRGQDDHVGIGGREGDRGVRQRGILRWGHDSNYPAHFEIHAELFGVISDIEVEMVSSLLSSRSGELGG